MATFVLVHGAFHGGWCWAPVARILRAHGHEVFTPTLTGLGERAHLMSSDITMETWVQDVVNVFECEELENVTLVGHSFGARPVSGAADRIPDRIRRIVFLDGGLPLDGLSKLDAMTPEARAARTGTSTDGGMSIPPPPVEYFGVHEPEIGAWLRRHLSAQPLGVERTALALGNELGNGLPVTYVYCTEAPLASTTPGAAYARTRQDWRYLELDAGHDCIVTVPEAVAVLLERECGH